MSDTHPTNPTSELLSSRGIPGQELADELRKVHPRKIARAHVSNWRRGVSLPDRWYCSEIIKREYAPAWLRLWAQANLELWDARERSRASESSEPPLSTMPANRDVSGH